MKRFCALLTLTLLVFIAFAQPPIKVLYLASEVPPTDGDTIMPGYLEEMGFDVTIEAQSPDSPSSEYDVAVISEVPEMDNTAWSLYSTAPLPMVILNVQYIESSALNWIAEGPGLKGKDYDNSPDSIITFLAPLSHPILHGFDPFLVQVVDNSTEAENLGWVALDETVLGITPVGQSGTDNVTHQAVVAIEAGTIINDVNILRNRAVILGFNQICWRFLNDAGKKMIKNSINWAFNHYTHTDVLTQPDIISENNLIINSIYPNPSTGPVHLKFDDSITDISVNILALDGKRVFSKQQFNPQLEALDLSELLVGMYFIQVEGSGISSTQKLFLAK